jgi:hypothetical protein
VTAGENKGERRGRTPERDGCTALGVRPSIRGAVDDGEVKKMVETLDFKFSPNRLSLSHCDRENVRSIESYD